MTYEPNRGRRKIAGAILLVGVVAVAVWSWQADQTANREQQTQEQQRIKDTETEHNLAYCLSKAQTNYSDKRYYECNRRYQSYLQCIQNGASFCLNPATDVTYGIPYCSFLGTEFEDRFSADLQNEKDDCFNQYPARK